MNQGAQDKWLARASALLPGFVLDRCRHDSVDLPALWVFRDGVQVGSCSMVEWSPGAATWRVCRMQRGMPTSERRFDRLSEGLRHIADGAAWQREGGR